MNLKAERINRGLSRRGAAREIDVPEQTLRRAERGLGVHPANAKKIADFYGCQVTDLWPLEAQQGAAAA